MFKSLQACLLLLFLTCLILTRPALAQTQSSKDLVHTSASIEGADGRFAVIVGVDAYDDPAIQDLRFAANDARAVAEVLILSGAWRRDQVVVMTPDSPETSRPTRNNVLAELGRLSELKNADTVLFYFSGHGSGSTKTGERENYLFPMDTRLSVPEDTAVPVRRVMQVLTELDAERKIAIFDACRNQIEVGTRGQGSTPSWFSSRYAEASGLRTIYATCFECYSWEDEDAELGVMTRYLVDGLSGLADGADNTVVDNVVGFEELYSYVYSSVLDWSNRTGNHQVPTLGGGDSAGSDFALVPVLTVGGQPCPASVDALAETLQRAQEAWGGGDKAAFGADAHRADVQLRCLDEPLRPELAASWFEVTALRGYEVQDRGSAVAALRAVAETRRGRAPLSGQHSLPRDLQELVQRAMESAPGERERQRVPRGARVLFDGVEGDRPTDRPTIAQALSCRNEVQWTRLLNPGDALPPIAPGACSERLDLALGVSAGGAALSAGGLYVASRLMERSFYQLTTRQDAAFDDPNTPPSIEGLRAEAERRAEMANTLGYAAQGAFVLALGLGIGFGVSGTF